MTEYATREEAIEALLLFFDDCSHTDTYAMVERIPGGWVARNGTDAPATFTYPAPRVIPPDLKTVWVRDDTINGWNITHSKGEVDRNGWLLCHDGNSWTYWTTEKPEGWRK